jgi:hypothetical protein
MELSEVGNTPLRAAGIRLQSARLLSVYVHDDRRRPYFKAMLDNLSGEPQISMDTEPPWWLREILIPVHPKLRLPFEGLKELAFRMVGEVDRVRRVGSSATALSDPRATMTVDAFFSLSSKYLEGFLNSESIVARTLFKVATRVALPRYIGVVTLVAPYFGRVDILVDGTSTVRNCTYLAVVALNPHNELLQRICVRLGQVLDCLVLS